MSDRDIVVDFRPKEELYHPPQAAPQQKSSLLPPTPPASGGRVQGSEIKKNTEPTNHEVLS